MRSEDHCPNAEVQSPAERWEATQELEGPSAPMQTPTPIQLNPTHPSTLLRAWLIPYLQNYYQFPF